MLAPIDFAELELLAFVLLAPVDFAEVLFAEEVFALADFAELAFFAPVVAFELQLFALFEAFALEVFAEVLFAPVVFLLSAIVFTPYLIFCKTKCISLAIIVFTDMLPVYTCKLFIDNKKSCRTNAAAVRALFTMILKWHSLSVRRLRTP